jgi:hypothetical protein
VIPTTNNTTKVWSLSVDGCASHEQGTLKNKEEKKKKKHFNPLKSFYNFQCCLFVI